MQRAGIDVKCLQYLMGHSNVSVTLDVYTHTDYEAVEQAFRRLRQAFDQAVAYTKIYTI